MTSRIPGTVSNLIVSQKVAAMGAIGLDTHRILGLAGLPAKSFEDPRGRLATEVCVPLWAAAVRVSGDPAIALRVGAALQAGALGSYEYLLRNSETLRETVVRADRFMKLMDDMARIVLVESDEVAVLRVHRVGGHPFPPHDVECLFSAVLAFGRKEVGAVRFCAVRFSHAPPTDPSRYERHFACPVRFGAEHDEMHLPAFLLEGRAPQADPNLGRVLQEHNEYLLSRLPSDDPFVYLVRSKLVQRLRDANLPDPRWVARELHMSARTLRRRLQAEGTGYHALLDDVRAQLARQYVLERREGFDAIATRLAFGDASAFFRAFKRWTGTTPAQYRKRDATGAPDSDRLLLRRSGPHLPARTRCRVRSSRSVRGSSR
jgi:AraC-like DNA-binding protein